MRQSLRKIRVILIVLFVGELGVYASYRCVNYKIIYNYNCSFYSVLPLSVKGIPMHGPLAPPPLPCTVHTLGFRWFTI